jgi:acyl transferase domain-containing protein
VTWEAFERAGLVMAQYRGHPVGVFIGCFTNDYLHIQFADPVGPKYSCGTGIELQQASEPLVAVDLPALLHNQWRQ